MKLKNDFPGDVRALWTGWWICLKCGGNGTQTGGLQGHHITGRDSFSALNCAPLCQLCHMNVTHSREEERSLVASVLRELHRMGYRLRERDFAFIQKHPDLFLGNEQVQSWLKG